MQAILKSMSKTVIALESEVEMVKTKFESLKPTMEEVIVQGSVLAKTSFNLLDT